MQVPKHTGRGIVLAVAAGLVVLLLATSYPVGMSTPARSAAVILVLAATLWITEIVPLFVTGFVILVLNLVWLQPVLDKAGMSVASERFMTPFFSDVILLFLGGFVLSSGLHKYRIDDRVARFIVHRTGRSIPRLLLGVMAVTAGLSMWLSNTASAATMLAICLPIMRGLPESDAYRKALLVGIAFAANIGGLGTPIGSPPNAIAMDYMRQAGSAPEFWMWMLIGVPGVLVMLVLTWGLLLVVFRGQQQEIEIQEPRSAVPLSKEAWIVVGGALATILGWVTTGWHGYSAGTVALIPVLIFFGLRLLAIEDFRGLSWDVLLILGGGACLGVAIDVSDLDQWIITTLPLSDARVFVVMVIFGTLGMAMSSVMSNTATANLLLPIVIGMQFADVTPVMVGVAFACSLAMPLPISTPPNAMVFGTGELRSVDMLGPGLVVAVVGTALALTTGYWWWDFVGLF